MLGNHCPYCDEGELQVVETERARHPFQTTVVCKECDGFAVRHANGRVYPLADRTDREADPLTRVVDGEE